MEVLVKLEGCDWMILTESTQVNDTAEWTVKMEAYENAKAAIVQSDFNGDADAPLTWEDKRTLDGYFRSQMEEFEGCTVKDAEYLAYAWGVLKANEAPLQIYTPEELSQLSPEEIVRYEKMFPPVMKNEIHTELMRFYDDRSFFKNCDWIITKCDTVKQKYGADSRCAMEIVKGALLKNIYDEVKGS